jgi:hypothetical protein
MHIPKTGGISFKKVLQDHFPNYYLYPKHIGDKEQDYNINLNNIQYNDILITGHWDFELFNRINKNNFNFYILTFLRNPQDRLISHYNYLRIHNDPNTSKWYNLINKNNLNCKEFYNLNEVKAYFSNIQAKQLAGNLWSKNSTTNNRKLEVIAKLNLNKFYFVGFLETFNYSINKFLDRIGKPIINNYQVPYLNKISSKKNLEIFLPKSIYEIDDIIYNYAKLL